MQESKQPQERLWFRINCGSASENGEMALARERSKEFMNRCEKVRGSIRSEWVHYCAWCIWTCACGKHHSHEIWDALSVGRAVLDHSSFWKSPSTNYPKSIRFHCFPKGFVFSACQEVVYLSAHRYSWFRILFRLFHGRPVNQPFRLFHVVGQSINHLAISFAILRPLVFCVLSAIPILTPKRAESVCVIKNTVI